MKTAIVVDNDHDIVEVFSDLLEMLEFDVISKGYDGGDAITMYEKFKPDVIFMDVHMEEMHGDQALKEIRTIDKDVKVVMVTGDMSKSMEDTLEKYGASAIIHKPFDIKIINEIITELENATSIVIQKA
ncbi:response regulator [Nitrosopumilus maritimus]|uniref:Response regulator receiver protein n=1 Tax=Nitrosopumilus maritimus (strain SCM1) TaxID=436308 RepID=A9A175_NITMS|nr:response regulator [Nitrosopumilus maritimus]ABX12361.1 response regulator receiver protein [Nitrosopumilus maritimus SCM1]